MAVATHDRQSRSERAARGASETLLRTGDRMTHEEFHRRYEQSPEDFKAELIGGIVYVASPVTVHHGDPHLLLGMLFGTYQGRTPGVHASDNATIQLGEEGQPQPDLFLRILPECGGQSLTTEEGYVQGAPELIIEIAHSSRAIDLNVKKDDYTRYGVLEYLVFCVSERELRWFDLTANQELQPDDAGVYRIRTFPGLWIDGQALQEGDVQHLLNALDQGLATAEHDEFVKHLQESRSIRE